MKKLLLLLSWSLLQSFSFSQRTIFENWKVNKGLQNNVYKNVTKTDLYGNVYVVGGTLNSSGNYDILLTKYNSNGTQIWAQQYNGLASGDDIGASLVLDDYLNIYVTGTVKNNATNGKDCITMK